VTNGSLKIVNKSIDGGEDVYLYTYHTAMDIPIWVKNIPALQAKKKNYIKNKRSAIEATEWDGTLLDWFFGTNYVAAGVIAASPFCLMPVSNNYFKQYMKEYKKSCGDYVLTLNEKDRTWHLTNEETEETINPIELFVNSFPE